MALAGGDELLLFAGSGQSLKPAEVHSHQCRHLRACASRACWACVLGVFVFRLRGLVQVCAHACWRASAFAHACTYVYACVVGMHVTPYRGSRGLLA